IEPNSAQHVLQRLAADRSPLERTGKLRPEGLRQRTEIMQGALERRGVRYDRHSHFICHSFSPDLPLSGNCCISLCNSSRPNAPPAFNPSALKAAESSSGLMAQKSRGESRNSTKATPITSCQGKASRLSVAAAKGLPHRQTFPARQTSRPEDRQRCARSLPLCPRTAS